MLRVSRALPFRKVRVDLLLVPKVECQRTVDLFEGQDRIAVNHALSRHSLAEQIDKGIERDASVSDAIDAFDESSVFPLHQITPKSMVTRRSSSTQEQMICMKADLSRRGYASFE